MKFSNQQVSEMVEERRERRQAPPPASPLQKACYGLVLAGALIMLVPAWQTFVGGLGSLRAERALERWAQAGREPALAEWQSAVDAAQSANRHYPVARGTYLDQLGQVESWHAFTQPARAPAATPSRQAALDAFRLAVAARPTWPETWARLAHAKFALGEVDDEFARAFDQANQWGPYRPAVQLELASIGVRAWPLLSPAQQTAVLGSMSKVWVGGYGADARNLFELARSAGMQGTLCSRAAEDNVRAQKLCTTDGSKS